MSTNTKEFAIGPSRPRLGGHRRVAGGLLLASEVGTARLADHGSVGGNGKPLEANHALDRRTRREMADRVEWNRRGSRDGASARLDSEPHEARFGDGKDGGGDPESEIIQVYQDRNTAQDKDDRVPAGQEPYSGRLLRDKKTETFT